VLGTVPVISFDGDDDCALGAGAVAGNFQTRDQARIIAALNQSSTSHDLQAPPIRIVHQHQGDAIIALQIPGTDVLHIAAKVRVADRPIVQDLEKAGRSATKLYIRPAGLTHARLIEPVAFADEFDFVCTQRIAVIVGVVHRRIGRAAPHAGLGGTHGGCECNVVVGAAHQRLRNGRASG
jgi:hypothetical protein